MASGFINLGIDKLGYYIGQCTDYVANTLSWIPSGLGNANQWLQRASSKGLQTTPTAAPGEVAVFTAPRFSAAGHVAVVESVNPTAGTMQIGDMNWAGPNIVTHHTLRISDAAGFIVGPGGPTSAAGGPVATAAPPSGIAAFFNVLGTDPNTFLIRAGFIILGITLVAVGLVVTFNQQGNVMKVAEVAAIA